jgi:hypothetical protein
MGMFQVIFVYAFVIRFEAQISGLQAWVETFIQLSYLVARDFILTPIVCYCHFHFYCQLPLVHNPTSS